MKRTSRCLLSLLLVVVLLFSSTSFAAANAPTAVTETAAVRVSEVEALRQTNAETYLMSDGTYECVVYSEDKYYYDSENALQRIDNSVLPISFAQATTVIMASAEAISGLIFPAQSLPTA